MTQGYRRSVDVAHQSFYPISAHADPWLQPGQGWGKVPVLSPPSLFEPDEDQQDWSPPVTPPQSPPNIAAIKRSLIQAQQFLSTASHIDPWTVNQITPPQLKLDKPKDQQQQQQPPVVEEEITTQNLYKTELCRSYMETNTCRYGVKCQFAHGRHELRPVMRHPKYKTEICKTFHTMGTCPYGTRCRFIHTRPKDLPTSDAISSSNSSEQSSPSFTPPDSPTLMSSSPPELLQWSTSWSPLERSLPPSPEEPVAEVEVEEEESEVSATRRLPIFRNLC